MDKNREDLNNFGNDIIESIYNKREKDILNFRDDEILTLTKRDRERCKTGLLYFLKETLSDELYQTANDYINTLSEKESKITNICNKRFYVVGINDGINLMKSM